MQQFFRLMVFFLCLSPAVSAQTGPVVLPDCQSKALIGDIDLSTPAQAHGEAKTAEPQPRLLAIVPIETALSGNPKVPTAYHGAATLLAPQPGPADYHPDCTPNRIP